MCVREVDSPPARPSRSFLACSRANKLTRLAFLAAIAALPLLPFSQAQAQQRIGAATTIKNQVTALRGGSNVTLGRGDSVFRAESVSTGNNSLAKLTFLDETNLSIGPSSRVVLDEFVFSPGNAAQTLTVNLARGAFRFSTGKLDKRAYKIQTSTATIGVRGTVLDIFSDAGQTLVTLVDNGEAFMCTTGTAMCSTLSIRGATFVIDTGGVRRSTSRRTRFSFQQYCAGAGGLCTRSRLASQQNNDTPPPAPQPIIQQATLPRNDAPAGCNVGGCLPVEVTHPVDTTPWAGVATGIYSSPSITTFFNSAVALPSTQRFPLQNGDQVTATLSDTISSEIQYATGTISTTVRVDPGFQYTAWGEWNGSVTVSYPGTEITNVPINRGLVVFGSLTPYSVMEAKTGTATYTGPILADFMPLDGGAVQPLAVGGTATVTANFSNRTVGGNLNMSLHGSPWANPTFTGVPIEYRDINGPAARFDGVLTGPSTTYSVGVIGGAFLGPNGQEVAGHFIYGSPGGIANGIFRGRQ